MGLRRNVLWIVGGLVLGFGIAALLGVLVFWAWPTYKKAKSPLGETSYGPIVVRYLKGSPVATQAAGLAPELAREWEEVTRLLGIPEETIPKTIYVYLHADADELPAVFSARAAEELTPLAVVDLLVTVPAAGPLAQLACSLAYGGPGNPVFPRGLALYLNSPDRNWAAEAMATGVGREWRLLFQYPDCLLPRDPWEQFFFEVDAPWISALPSLETVRWLLSASTSRSRGAQGWEALAAAFAGYVLAQYGDRGVRAFWLASGWEKGALGVGVAPEGFASQWEEHLEKAFDKAQADPVMRAKHALYSGRPTEALARLAGLEKPEADELRAQAYVALGELRAALPLLEDTGNLESLASTQPITAGRLVLWAERGSWGEELARADEALARALSFWGLSGEDLPERIAIYLTDVQPPLPLPWGVLWTSPDRVDLAKLVVRFVSTGVSPLGLPRFDALTEGLFLVLAHPERDYRSEAAKVAQAGRWVSLNQSLFGSYPSELAEAEAGTLVSFLLESYGPEVVKGLWQALLAGRSPYSAVAEVVGISFDELDLAVRSWASGD